MHTGPEINLNLLTVISSSRGVFNRLYRSNIHITQSIRRFKYMLVRVSLLAQARSIQTIPLHFYFLFFIRLYYNTLLPGFMGRILTI